jgi:hypothetical protein
MILASFKFKEISSILEQLVRITTSEAIAP